ncbi:MAG: hypothetical protein ACOYD0_06360 [Candidatus Nanopelagicales bacterium]
MGIFSRDKASTGVKALVPNGERLLGWATGPARLDGEPTIVVVTNASLITPGYLGALPWQVVLRAAWDEPVLEVVTLPGSGGTAVTRITLDQPGSVPQLVWERVNSTIVMQRHVDLVGSSGVTLVARRQADSDDINWQFVFDAGLDPADEQLREQAAEELAIIRDSAGI